MSSQQARPRPTAAAHGADATYFWAQHRAANAALCPSPPPTVANLDAYLLERAAIGDPRLRAGSRAPLFVRHDGTPLNQQFVDSLLRRLAAASGVVSPEGAMAHALRHSYGMELALRGVPLPVIQQLLGHSDPRTTSIYTAAHASDLTDTLHEAGLL